MYEEDQSAGILEAVTNKQPLFSMTKTNRWFEQIRSGIIRGLESDCIPWKSAAEHCHCSCMQPALPRSALRLCSAIALGPKASRSLTM